MKLINNTFNWVYKQLQYLISTWTGILEMRTYGKNDFKEFEFVRDDNVGKGFSLLV